MTTASPAVRYPRRRILRAVMHTLAQAAFPVVSRLEIQECPVNIECRVRDILPMGSHDVFVGEVAVIHAEDWALDENGYLDPVRARALALVGRSYWAVGAKVARAFTRHG